MHNSNTSIVLPLEFKRAARMEVLGTFVRRNHRSAATVNLQTPVKWIDGDAAPVVKGEPYWKTNFSNGCGFSKTLYTPSTLRIVVGIDWKTPAQRLAEKLECVYSNDNH